MALPSVPPVALAVTSVDEVNSKMKQPEHWQPLKSESKEEAKPSSIVEAIRVICCVLFLLAACGVWFTIDSGFGRVVYFLLLAIPCYICGEWLSTKIFNEKSRWSITQSGFSLTRIFAVLLIVSTILSIAYFIAVFMNLI